MAIDNDEARAIDAAYQQQVRDLFRVLNTSLIHGESEHDCVQRFREGIEIARHARQLALGAVKDEQQSV